MLLHPVTQSLCFPLLLPNGFREAMEEERTGPRCMFPPSFSASAALWTLLLHSLMPSQPLPGQDAAHQFALAAQCSSPIMCVPPAPSHGEQEPVPPGCQPTSSNYGQQKEMTTQRVLLSLFLVWVFFFASLTLLLVMKCRTLSGWKAGGR